MNYSRNGGLLFQKEVHNAYLWALRIGKLRHFEVYRTAIISKVLSAFRQVMTNVLQERQPHRAPNSTPTGAKPQKVGRFRSKTADFSSFLPLFFPQVHHFCSFMAIPSRGFRFFRCTAHRVESEKHRSPTSVGGLRRGHVSDLAFHVKRFTRIHFVLAQQVGEEEGMGEPSADGEDNKRWARRRKGAVRTLSLGVHSGLVILWKVRKFVSTRLFYKYSTSTIFIAQCTTSKPSSACYSASS